jgi:hypothetical protein
MRRLNESRQDRELYESDTEKSLNLTMLQLASLPSPTLRIATSFLFDSYFFTELILCFFKAISGPYLNQGTCTKRGAQNKVGHSQISLCNPGTDFASP